MNIKCKKLVIETDGTTQATKVSVDGEVLGYLRLLEFKADASQANVSVRGIVMDTVKIPDVDPGEELTFEFK